MFGGGEPTLYKHNGELAFHRILEMFKKRFFSISVTTKNYKLHEHPAFEDIVQNCGSIAISCNRIEDVPKVKELIGHIQQVHYDGHWDDRTTVCVQIILGLTPLEQFKELFYAVCECTWSINILGAKSFGRGAEVRHYPLDASWIGMIKERIWDSERSYWTKRIGIDSPLVSRWYNELILTGVEHFRLQSEEGKNTCYIDATKQIVKPSSFCDEEYPYEKGKFLDVFAKF